MDHHGRMEQAAAPALSSSDEESPRYGETAFGNPTALQHEYGYPSDGWSTSLFQCYLNPAIWLLTCFCPCVTFGRIAEIVDRGRTSCLLSACLYEVIMHLTGCGCLYAASFRSKLRARYHLPDMPAPDWAVHFLCESCALAQEYRELQRRGYDMSIGNVTMQHCWLVALIKVKDTLMPHQFQVKNI